MKRFASIAAALGLAAVLSTPALAQDDRKDLQIFKDISDQVQTYARFTIFDDVAASVDKGRVILTGRVTMPFKSDDIIRRVERVAGVRGVENRIEVLPVSRFDDDLRYGIARAIYGNPAFVQYSSMSNPPIHIVVENGKVRLTGVVNSNVERALARVIASGSLAFSVTNELQTDAEVRTALEKVGG